MKIIPVICAAAMLCTSCASILSKNVYNVKIDSTPQGKDFTVMDARRQVVVLTGRTPETVELSSGGNVRAGDYRIEIQDGDKTVVKNVTATIDGCFWANLIVLPFFIEGMLIDGCTGAAWKLPKEIHINLPDAE